MHPTALAGANVDVPVVVVPMVIRLPTSYRVAAYSPMPGMTVPVHPAFMSVHGVRFVPGSVYPATQLRINCVLVLFSVEKAIQLTPFNELTANRWLNPTELLVLVRLGLPIPWAQCGQLVEGVEEWQLLTVNTFEKSALPEPISPLQVYLASAPLLRK